MKVLFAHQVVTAYPVKNILGKLLKHYAQCQDKTVEQLWDEGVRGFDIRFRVKENRDIEVCHGLVTYDVSIWNILDFLKSKQEETKEEVYIRIANENEFKIKKCSKDKFQEVVDEIMDYYHNFKYEIIDDKKSWNITYTEFREQSYECLGSKLVPFITPRRFSKYFNYTFKRLMSKVNRGFFYFDFI